VVAPRDPAITKWAQASNSRPCLSPAENHPKNPSKRKKEDEPIAEGIRPRTIAGGCLQVPTSDPEMMSTAPRSVRKLVRCVEFAG
jgi:hypothetical protein